MADMEHTIEALTDLAAEHGADWDLEIDTAHECSWACRVRITPKPNDHGRPDRSFVTYATGGVTPEQVAGEAVGDALAWFAERTT